MNIQTVTACVQVKKDYGNCFDFYTKQMGLVPIYGDRTGPYTSFSNCKDGQPFFAMYDAQDLANRTPGYKLSKEEAASGTLSAVFHSSDFQADYRRMQEAGIEMELADMDGTFQMAIFCDPEGNMLSLEDGGV